MRQNTELMATSRDLLPASHGGGSDVLDLGSNGDPSSAGAAQANPLHKLQLLLKGRYHWAIALAAVGLVAGGLGGYLAGKPYYMSRGLIRVQPVLPSVLSAEERGMAYYDSFMDSQVMNLQTQRVLDLAVQTEAWRKTGRSGGPDAVENLLETITVARPKGSQIIQVACTDPDPAVAQAAVTAILEVYKKISAEQDSMSGEEVLRVLQNLITTGLAEQAAIRNSIRSIATTHGNDDLLKMYDAEWEILNKERTTLGELEAYMAAMAPAPGQPDAPTSQPTAELGVEELATRDVVLGKLVAERDETKRAMARLELQGVGPNHRMMILTRAAVDDVEGRIEKRVEDLRRMIASGQIVTSPVAAGGTGDRVVDQKMLQERITRLTARVRQKEETLKSLGQQRLEIDRLRQEEATIQAKLDVYRKRQEQLNLQDKVAGRTQIPERGERPTIAKDTRIKFAGGGAFGGAALGFGIVVLVGLLDRRFRSPEEVRASMTGSPMLGVLPELPDDLSDPEQAALTAHFVHQIRTLLQIWDSGVGTQVFSITSPVSGTGKTSLTLALGVSFAASDSRTLLIDCDLVGGGLTTRANAIVKRKIGRILQREGLLTDRQLEEALKLASGSRRRLGEILVELGYLKEADLDSALVTQQKGTVGLLEVINGEDLKDCVAETGIAGLSILPLGGAQAQHASKINPQSLRRVLAEARKHYDTILLDTGPVPGSLEAAVVAAEVDGVILCVSRGEQRPLAEKCVQHLLSVGAKVAGVVFNRAKTTDMSVYGTAVRTSMPATSVPARGADSARFGPMAQAVTYGGPAEEGNGAGATGNTGQADAGNRE